METQEPIYIGPIFPSHYRLQDEEELDELNPSSNIDIIPQENNFVNKMDTPISNVLFNIITLVNALIHFCLLIFVKVSFKPGGWFYNLYLIWYKCL